MQLLIATLFAFSIMISFCSIAFPSSMTELAFGYTKLNSQEILTIDSLWRLSGLHFLEFSLLLFPIIRESEEKLERWKGILAGSSLAAIFLFYAEYAYSAVGDLFLIWALFYFGVSLFCAVKITSQMETNRYDLYFEENVIKNYLIGFSAFYIISYGYQLLFSSFWEPFQVKYESVFKDILNILIKVVSISAIFTGAFLVFNWKRITKIEIFQLAIGQYLLSLYFILMSLFGRYPLSLFGIVTHAGWGTALLIAHSKIKKPKKNE